MIYLNLSPLSDNTKIHTHSNFFTWHSVPYSTYIHHNHSSETASSNMTNKFNCCCLNYLLIPNFTSSLHNTCQSNIPFLIFLLSLLLPIKSLQFLKRLIARTLQMSMIFGIPSQALPSNPLKKPPTSKDTSTNLTPA